jgi:3-methyladenine DNA glycosylase/8-oxoguanine DNA glycosylase
MKLTLAAPAEFNLWRTIYSHGWCVLTPFAVNDDRSPFLHRTEHLATGRVVTYCVSQPVDDRIHIEVSNGSALSASDKTELKRNVRTTLRLDEDYSEFYRQARKLPQFRWIPKIGAGRLLCSPTVFEDAVKMMCTTNCSWGLTTAMVRNMCVKLGKQDGEGRFAFPTPEAIAGCTESYIRKEIRAGYRSPYIVELAKRVHSRDLDLEAWRHSTSNAAELFAEVRSVKGLGPYAAGNLLKLLGRYDYLAIDSWCRKRFAKHTGKKRITDKMIESYYKPYGEWRGLFIWLELTKEWYDKKFPI